MALENLPDYVQKYVQQIVVEHDFSSNSDVMVSTTADKCVLGANFNVIVKNAEDQRELFLFIKCLLKTESCYTSEAKQYFNNEIVFYGDILNYFLKLENVRIKYIRSPLTCITKCLCVGNQDEPFIMMENLMNQGYVALNIKEPLSLGCMHLVLQELGRFHAYSFAVKDQNPQLFTIATSRLKETAFYINVESTYRKLFLHAIHDALKLAKQTLPPDSVFIQKLSGFILNVFNKMIALAKGDDEDEQYRVVTHGDLWPNNMLYKFQNDKSQQPGNVVFVDFQGCRYSSPVHDLMFVLLVSVDQSTRERHREDLIRSYHTTLCETLEQLGSDPLRLFPYSALQSQIRKHARFALAMALAGLPLYLDEGPRPTYLEEELKHTSKAPETLDISIRHIHARKTMKCKNKMMEILMDVVNQGWL